ncbi:uncharacterized protein PGTG_13888 [Puccinia graminis f. sp. tritici CRL 75-36-700-3]|uniref:SH3 domain-containing protein n=1 Tax=Puccinia graminis f. sp. tritici (strain CRL 75-36-700-3 / race SCCL) TaxID=418459 RepID=E3KT92_PUCGT|nr:uncharacterized protein PGTG_13888 [Puccinia graminis f. sp. tritici CRL 75-36-700-3]EFP87517.1 hypothetical protein PGTG_13888 [Puccinia graminis f. sp. tritici CRL 75-36-700-3]
MSHCTAAETMTATNSRTRRPMSTSIIPSLSLDSRPPLSSKRASTPYPTHPPKRPSSTSLAALSSSQSRVALNLLNRISTQNSLRSSSESSPPPQFIVRDFAFKSSDPRHLGQRLTTTPNHHHLNGTDEASRLNEFNHQLADQLKQTPTKSMFWNICASPTGPGSTADSEFDRDQEEAEQSMEIDKLIHKNRQNSSSSALSSSSSTPPLTDPLTVPQQQQQQQQQLMIGENGGEQMLTRLTTKWENLYVSMYDFVAEGESEMNLAKGEIVCVLEIICDGWVVARKTKLLIDDDGKLFSPDRQPVSLDDLNLVLLRLPLPDDPHHHDLSLTGLCPENYLLKIS